MGGARQQVCVQVTHYDWLQLLLAGDKINFTHNTSFFIITLYKNFQLIDGSVAAVSYFSVFILFLTGLQEPVL